MFKNLIMCVVCFLVAIRFIGLLLSCLFLLWFLFQSFVLVCRLGWVRLWLKVISILWHLAAFVWFLIIGRYMTLFVVTVYLCLFPYFDELICNELVVDSFSKVGECVILLLLFLFYCLFLRFLGLLTSQSFYSYFFSVLVAFIVVMYHCLKSGLTVGVSILMVRLCFLFIMILFYWLVKEVKQFVKTNKVSFFFVSGAAGVQVGMVSVRIESGVGCSEVDGVPPLGGASDAVVSRRYINLRQLEQASTSTRACASADEVVRIADDVFNEEVINAYVDRVIANYTPDMLFPRTIYADLKGGKLKACEIPAEGREAYKLEIDLCRQMIREDYIEEHKHLLDYCSTYNVLVRPEIVDSGLRSVDYGMRRVLGSRVKSTSGCCKMICCSEGVGFVGKFFSWVGSSCVSCWGYLKDLFF
jgi:hypothetical protein